MRSHWYYAPMLALLPFHPMAAPDTSRGTSVWYGDWTAGVTEASGSDGTTVLVIAYAAIWVILLLYVVRLASRLRSLRRDIEELKRIAARAAEKQDTKEGEHRGG